MWEVFILAKRKKITVGCGHWLEMDNCMTVCSECGSLGCDTNFCPNCGAYMRGGDFNGESTQGFGREDQGIKKAWL